MDATATATEQLVTIGRADYGTQQTVTLVTIEGCTFYRTASGQVLEPCGRCSVEAGSLRAFSNVLAGVCFGCTGRGWVKNHGTVEQAAKVLRRRAKDTERRAAKAAAKAEAHLAERDARYAAWTEANPRLAAALAARFAAAHTDQGENAYYAHVDTLTRDEAQLLSLAESARWEGGLTEGQQQLATDLLMRIQVKLATTHLGTVGEKLTVTGTVAFKKVIDGYYGSKMLVKVQDSAGNYVVTFTTAAWAWEVEQDERITITGTVTEHSHYDGAAQTVLNRPKVQR